MRWNLITRVIIHQRRVKLSKRGAEAILASTAFLYVLITQFKMHGHFWHLFTFFCSFTHLLPRAFRNFAIPSRGLRSHYALWAICVNLTDDKIYHFCPQLCLFWEGFISSHEWKIGLTYSHAVRGEKSGIKFHDYASNSYEFAMLRGSII